MRLPRPVPAVRLPRRHRLPHPRRWALVTLAGWLVLGAVSAFAADPAPAPATALAEVQRVGLLARPENIILEGNRTFSRTSILYGISWRREYPRVAHPASALRQFRALLEKGIVEGYQHEGFHEAKVTVAAEESPARLRVRIEEGLRFRCGSTRVEGLPGDLARRLRERLAEAPYEAPPANADSPSRVLTWPWNPGRPARTDPDSMAVLRETAKAALASLNHAEATLELRLVPAPDEGVLDLVIQGNRPAGAGTLEDIEVEGLERDTRADLLAFLQLAPGRSLPEDFAADVQARLTASARYRRAEATLVPGTAAGQVRLHLKLEEFAEAPGLLQPWSPTESALLACRRWLLDQEHWEHDLIATFETSRSNSPPLHWEAVISPDGVAILQRDPAASNAPPRYAIVGSRELVGAYALERKRKLVRTQSVHGFVFVVNLAPSTSNEGGRFTFTIGGGINSATPGVPFNLRIELDPAAVVSLAHPLVNDLRVRTNANVVTLESADPTDGDEYRAEIDPVTGRPHRLEFTFHNSATADGGSREVTRIGLRTEVGAFAAAVRNLADLTRDHPNDFDPRRPLGSVARFLAPDAAAALTHPGLGTPPSGPALEFVRQGLGPLLENTDWDALFAPLAGPLFGPAPAGESEEFPLGLGFGTGSWQTGNDLSGLVADLALRVAEELWPAESWPHALLRGAILALTGDLERATHDLHTVARAPDLGPLGAWLAGRFVPPAPSIVSNGFPELGLARLHPADARRELVTLLDGPTAGPRLLRGILATFRSVALADLRGIASAVGWENSRPLDPLIDAARALSNQPPSMVLGPLIEADWTNGIASFLRERLESLPPGVAEPATAAGQLQRARSLFFGTPGGPPTNPAAAFVLLRRAAEQGEPEAEHALAKFLEEGIGGPPDLAAALPWYRRAAEHHQLHAGCRLANLSLEGRAGSAGREEALGWFRGDAELGCELSALRLGMLLLDGPSSGHAEAERWLLRSVELGHPAAAFVLGRYHEQAGRIPAALNWYRKAAFDGLPEAQAELGDRLIDGFTTRPDPFQAYIWLQLAVRHGQRMAEPGLARAARSLTPDQLRIARSRIEWVGRQTRFPAPTNAPPAK